MSIEVTKISPQQEENCRQKAGDAQASALKVILQ